MSGTTICGTALTTTVNVLANAASPSTSRNCPRRLSPMNSQHSSTRHSPTGRLTAQRAFDVMWPNWRFIAKLWRVRRSTSSRLSTSGSYSPQSAASWVSSSAAPPWRSENFAIFSLSPGPAWRLPGCHKQQRVWIAKLRCPLSSPQ